MSREIDAPYKPKKGDQVMFNGPPTVPFQMKASEDVAMQTSTYHGKIMKVLPPADGKQYVHIEATSGKWYEAEMDEDNVRPHKEQEHTL